MFLVDYRGFGLSSGKPSEKGNRSVVVNLCGNTSTIKIFRNYFLGLYVDANAALNYLSSRQDINTERIFVYGESLGGAVAVQTGKSI
jgi:cephalosporin-C deacetylase-like acetyl esterase